MKSVSLLLVLGLSVATVASSCGGKPSPQNPVPNADSAAAADRARQDSIAAAQAEADRLAREEQERLARQREADSLAALSRGAEEVRNMLATMIHFDLDYCKTSHLHFFSITSAWNVLQDYSNMAFSQSLRNLFW